VYVVHPCLTIDGAAIGGVLLVVFIVAESVLLMVCPFAVCRNAVLLMLALTVVADAMVEGVLINPIGCQQL